MKFHDLANWYTNESSTALLLFAQTLEELVSFSSHDSHKAPVFNFNCLCSEILKVIQLIDENILEKGNIIPLFSEMRSSFNSDPLAQSILGCNFDDLFMKKDTNGVYQKNKLQFLNDSEASLSFLKNVLQFIHEELNKNYNYYNLIKTNLKRLISTSDSEMKNSGEIVKLTRILSSELINRGYTQYYIDDCINEVFFSGDYVNDVDTIDDFFNHFTMEKNDYVLYFPIKSERQKLVFESCHVFDFAPNVYEMFDLNTPYILKFDCPAIDPYSARSIALDFINICLSANQFISHDKYEYNQQLCEAVDRKDGKVYCLKKSETPFFCVKSNIRPINATQLLDTCIKIRGPIFQVLQLHASAVNSKNVANQIINLWTAIEVSVPVFKNTGTNRITQISNVLTTVLSRKYFLSLVNQLFSDIVLVAPSAISIINSIDCGRTNAQKLLSMILLGDYVEQFQELKKLLFKSAPLLVYRLHFYKEQWSTPKTILNYYNRHSLRLSQQIMRIYRTRNMLIHDGQVLHYSELVLQNLHYYLDSYVNFLDEYGNEGYRLIPSIITAAQLEEQKYLCSLNTNDSINKDNIFKFITI